MSADGVEALRRLIDDARNVVAFTGAGMSTDSGIPDFRGPSGLWTRLKPIQFQDFVASEAVRQESWRRKFSGEPTLEKAEPNAGHRALAALVEAGKVSTVITQNVDDLHRRSGIAPSRIVELHGNATRAACLDCGLHRELDDVRTEFERSGTVAPCRCGGLFKTATISFGQAMPEEAMARAEAATRACDCFLVLGSSLSVYPAAAFPELACQLGARLAIVNREATPQDGYAALVLHDELSTVLSAVAQGC